MKIRNTYLEKQIRTKYVPNGVFVQSFLLYLEKQIRIWYVHVLIRTKYIPITYCVFPFSLRIYVLKLVKYALLIFLWATWLCVGIF